MTMSERNNVRDSLIHCTQENTKTLAQCVAEPMKYFAPQQVLRAAQLVALNENVVEVDIYSSVFDISLAHIKIPFRSHKDLYTCEEIAYFDDLPVGSVRISISMTPAMNNLLWNFQTTIVVFLLLFLSSFCITSVVFRTTIARPIHRLLDQTEKISSQLTDGACAWTDQDEFSHLGRAIENMRQKLALQFQKIDHQARTDTLTGISNRRDFYEQASRAIHFAQKQDEAFSLIMFDLDNFKNMNDTYGHLIGDDLLMDISALIQKNIRSTDLFARWGGEEFILGLLKTDKEQAFNVAEKLREAIASAEFSKDLHITASFGVVQLNKDNNENMQDVLKLVDQAMYQAKERGKNCTVVL